METNPSNYGEYRAQAAEEAAEYQDFVMLELAKRGLPLLCFTSRKYQIEIGESVCGFEIKFDRKLRLSGNLWIETGEKASPREGEYVASGIYRNDNSFLYLIGDYQQLFVFGKKHLVMLHQRKFKDKMRENGTKTSRGFLVEAKYAELVCLKHYRFTAP